MVCLSIVVVVLGVLECCGGGVVCLSVVVVCVVCLGVVVVVCWVCLRGLGGVLEWSGWCAWCARDAYCSIVQDTYFTSLNNTTHTLNPNPNTYPPHSVAPLTHPPHSVTPLTNSI